MSESRVASAVLACHDVFVDRSSATAQRLQERQGDCRPDCQPKSYIFSNVGPSLLELLDCTLKFQMSSRPSEQFSQTTRG